MFQSCTLCGSVSKTKCICPAAPLPRQSMILQANLLPKYTVSDRLPRPHTGTSNDQEQIEESFSDNHATLDHI